MSANDFEADSDIEFFQTTFGEQVYDQLAMQGLTRKVFSFETCEILKQINNVEEMKLFLEHCGYPDIILYAIDPAAVVRQIANRSITPRFPDAGSSGIGTTFIVLDLFILAVCLIGWLISALPTL